MKKRIVITILSVLIVMIIPTMVSATDKTRNEALAWAQSQVGNSLDYDGAYGAQCVDLIKYYYAYLGVTPVAGNGCDYATNTLPAGWQRLQGVQPEPGDILVYSAASTNSWAGHVAIYESDYVHYDQNIKGKYGVVKCTWHYASADPYWGVVRPNFSDVQAAPPSAPTGCLSESWSDRVQIQWNKVDNASGYECGLIDINTRETIVKTTNTEADWYHNFYNVPEGQYWAYVAAYNSAGYSSHSNWYRVDVVLPAPNKPIIKSDYQFIKEGGAPTVSWEAVDNAASYNYYLAEYPEAYGHVTNTTSGNTSNTYVTFKNLKNGRYTCFINPVSAQGKWGERSNMVSFDIYADDYIPTKTIVADNHIYALYDYEMSWSFAKDLCTDLGGNLVTITSAEENQVVSALIQSGSKDAYWLGATDGVYGTEKDFKWVTGEEFSYSNWKSGEPSSSGTDGEKEHFVEMRKSYGYQWNDVNNISKSNKGFILEVDLSNLKPTITKTYNGHQYLLFDKNTTWTEAKTICEQAGGHLVTIESNKEKQFVQQLLKDGQRVWYYLGGQKEGDIWKWENGNNVEYISWADNATAAWNGTNLMMYKSTGNCIGLHNAYYPERDIQHIGFVCEIDYIPAPIDTFTITQGGTSAQIQNNTSSPQTVTIIIAHYDSQGALSGLSTQKVTFIAKETRTFTASGNYKVFVWDSLSGLKPLAE